MNAFEAIKERVSIAAVLTAAGAKFTGGHWNPAPCCGHRDCLSVDEAKRVFKCHSCDAKGSVIDLAMKMYQVDESEALRRLAGDYGVELPEGDAAPKKPVSKAGQIRAAAADFYHARFMEKDNPGYEYFCGAFGSSTAAAPKCRGHREETARRLKVGWANGKLLDHLKGLGFKQADIRAAGLYVDKDDHGGDLAEPHDYWKWGYVVFPVIDETGQVIAFTGKLARPYVGADGKTFKGKVSAGKKDWFLNHAALMRFDELVLVEGENDLATLIDCGAHNVIGTAGSIGEEQLRLLRNHLKGKKLVLWFDCDEGGHKLTKRVLQALRSSDVEVRVVNMPRGPWKDADDYLQEAIAGKTEKKKEVGSGVA